MRDSVARSPDVLLVASIPPAAASGNDACLAEWRHARAGCRRPRLQEPCVFTVSGTVAI
ncbi:MAG: hypothetical protein IPI20_09355 [Rhodoferax sp.]|nr:hypothetical protein [Rhodoferax sp.]